MILGLTTMRENSLHGGSREILEGRGFSPAVSALTHHFVAPLSRSRERGRGEGVASDGGAEEPV